MAPNLAGAPSRLQFVVRGRLYGQLRPAPGAKAVEEQRQVAVTQLAGAGGVADLQRGELLEDRAEVVDGGVRADGARLLGAREQHDVELARPRRRGVELLRRPEGAGEPLGERAGVGVDLAVHEGGERLPGILLVRERGLRRLDVAPQAVRAERAQQGLLAGVAAVERADSDARVLGHRGDRRLRVGHEDRAGGLQDLRVVARGFGDASSGHDVQSIGTERSVSGTIQAWTSSSSWSPSPSPTSTARRPSTSTRSASTPTTTTASPTRSASCS